MAKLAMSNIAWTPDDEPGVALQLQALGVESVEIAPTKVFADPLRSTSAERAACLGFWGVRGISVIAFQSMLFGRPDLTVFDSVEQRLDTLRALRGFIQLAGEMGVGRLVFGSPKNRVRPRGMSAQVALEIAVDFFSRLASFAKEEGTVFCIEPNPEDYGCNFVVNAEEGRSLVELVDHEGFGLHLDIAGMTLAGDDVEEQIFLSRHVLRHFHVSAPNLQQISELGVDHQGAARALRGIGYDGFVSIEMRDDPSERATTRVVDAVSLARREYSTVLATDASKY